MNNIGSNFDDFLKEENIYQEVTMKAIEKTIFKRWLEKQTLEQLAKLNDEPDAYFYAGYQMACDDMLEKLNDLLDKER